MEKLLIILEIMEHHLIYTRQCSNRNRYQLSFFILFDVTSWKNIGTKNYFYTNIHTSNSITEADVPCSNTGNISPCYVLFNGMMGYNVNIEVEINSTPKFHLSDIENTQGLSFIWQHCLLLEIVCYKQLKYV